MDESKKAAKAFVDQYFPVKESRKSSDVWGELFQPNSKKETSKKHGYYGSHSLNSHTGIADGKLKGSMKKGQNIPQKGNNLAEHCEISEPCLMSSSVDYGCRDNYPYNSNHQSNNYRYNPDNRYPCPSSYTDKTDKKEGTNYDNPETEGASEWWQGSYYY